MKILRIIYDWPKPWQGLAPHPYEITVSQTKKGDDVTVLSGFWPKAGGPEKPNNIKVIPIYREPFPGTIFFTSSVLLFFKYLSWRRKKSNKVDIVHSHGHFGIWVYLYRYVLQRLFPWSKELKTPLVVHFHNIPDDRKEKLEEKGVELTNKTKYVSTPMESKAARWAVKTAAACIFVSEEGKKGAIEHYNADPRRCFVVETGVNTDLFVPVHDIEKEKSRRDMGMDQYDRVIFNHGVLNERKNIHKLIEAMKYLPDTFKLLLIGPAESVYKNKLKELIKELGLIGRVTMSGYTPYPEIPIAYQISDLFVLPSNYEGLPKAVMQGLACGVPCLVSGFKLSEPLSGLEYLDVVEPKVLAAKIMEITERNPGVDLNKVKQFYSWDVRVREIDKIYEFAKENYLV